MSDFEATPVDETPEAAAPVEGEAPPPTPEPEEKEVSDDDLKRAFTALSRKKTAHKEKLQQLHQERSRFEEERKAHQAQIALIERLRRGDEDALKEAMGDDYFDQLVQKRLDPAASQAEAKLKAELQRRDQELETLKRRLDDFDQGQRQAQMQREEASFLGYVKGLDAPELDVLEEAEILDLVRDLAPRFREEAGRPPTFKELGQILVNMQKPKIERLKKRFGPPPPEAPPPGKKGPGGITNRDASTPAGATPEEGDDMDAFRERMKRQLLERLG
ncbi:MAG: hypothetical protein IPL79_19915 [Myxococcales bacterium]|nr:hypothetical protein [Myxococcales bacterium]